MSDLNGVVGYARRWIELHRENKFQREAAKIMQRVVDALVSVRAERDAATERARQAEAELRDMLRVDIPSLKAERDAALARIAELEAELEVAMRPHSECERSGAEAGERIVDLEGDLARAETRMADALEARQVDEAAAPDGQVIIPIARIHELRAAKDAALAAIERVRAIHVCTAFDDAPDKYYCKRCQITAGTWPCETIQALDGAPEPEEKP